MGFWIGFSFLLRGEPGALWVCSGVALLTLLGSLSALVPIDFVPFSFLMVIFAGVPLYGLRFLWNGRESIWWGEQEQRSGWLALCGC